MEYPTLELKIEEFSCPDRVLYSVSLGDEYLGRFDSKEELIKLIEGLLQGRRLMMPPQVELKQRAKS